MIFYVVWGKGKDVRLSRYDESMDTDFNGEEVKPIMETAPITVGRHYPEHGFDVPHSMNRAYLFGGGEDIGSCRFILPGVGKPYKKPLVPLDLDRVYEAKANADFKEGRGLVLEFFGKTEISGLQIVGNTMGS